MARSEILTQEMLEQLKEARRSGVSLKALSESLGISWQKIDKAIRNGLPKSGGVPVRTSPASLQLVKNEPKEEREISFLPRIMLSCDPSKDIWVDRYRPEQIHNMLLSEEVKASIRQIMKKQSSRGIMLHGGTGIGKTTLARCLAREFGCNPDEHIISGCYTVSSGEQTAESVRELFESLHYSPMNSTGWKVAILNECDKMSSQAEAIWLDRLENLPRKTLVIFTTNHVAKLTARFRDRCTVLNLDHDTKDLLPMLLSFLSQIWFRETHELIPPQIAQSVVRRSFDEKGNISIRRAVSYLEVEYWRINNG